MRRDATNDKVIECKYCGKQYSKKSEFMIHRKIEHPGTVANRKNNKEGKCNFAAGVCWWSHDDMPIDSASVSCFICNDTFSTKNEMMKHRKRNHNKLVKECHKFKEQLCKFKSDACWFFHEDENLKKNEEEKDEIVMENEINMESVFRKSSWNMKPPFKGVQKKQKME